jgi:hypothetical protein
MCWFDCQIDVLAVQCDMQFNERITEYSTARIHIFRELEFLETLKCQPISYKLQAPATVGNFF